MSLWGLRVMNIEEIKALTDHELDEKIAEALGWAKLKRFKGVYARMGSWIRLPEYSSNLNVVNEELQGLNDKLSAAYVKAFQKIVLEYGSAVNDNEDSVCLSLELLAAGPRKKAEALLLMLLESNKDG